MDDVLRRRDLEEFRAEFKLDLAEMQTRLIVCNIATVIAMAGVVLAAVKF